MTLEQLKLIVNQISLTDEIGDYLYVNDLYEYIEEAGLDK